ncbi:MAG: hypothetical protein H6581_11100 [Bacteroidia bacterium]|nr:hypothetical protein [Bacteroidia bacterium]
MQIPPKLLLILGCALLLAACSNVQIDNSSKNSVIVTVDGAQHDLGAGERKSIKLSAGQHSLKIRDVTGKSLADTTFSLAEGGLINAGGGEYVIWKTLYGLQKDRATLLHEEWVEMDSTEFFGDFKLIGPKTSFVEQTWDHNLDQDFPTSQKLLIFSDFVIESKLFREKDFKAEYRRMSTPQ